MAARPMEDPSRAQQEELIISPTLEIENRWKFIDQIIDYDAIEPWNSRRLAMDNSNLLRMKLCGLQGPAIHALLASLAGPAAVIAKESALRQLEIDTLNLPTDGQQQLYVFNSLRRLSIDSVLKPPATQTVPKIRFLAPVLAYVSLGKCSPTDSVACCHRC